MKGLRRQLHLYLVVSTIIYLAALSAVKVSSTGQKTSVDISAAHDPSVSQWVFTITEKAPTG